MPNMKYWHDIARTLHHIADCVGYYERIAPLPDCNTCGKRKCEYRPKLGETVRINCPLWIEEGDET
jgi:hypothetical protein